MISVTLCHETFGSKRFVTASVRNNDVEQFGTIGTQASRDIVRVLARGVYATEESAKEVALGVLHDYGVPAEKIRFAYRPLESESFKTRLC